MIIGISGLAGSGKDTAASFLVKNHNFVRIGLADPLKRICKDVFDFSDEQLWGPSSARNTPDERFLRSRMDASQYLSPRYALQRLGTEWGRDCYEDVWIGYGLRVARRLLEDVSPKPEVAYSAKAGLHYKTDTCFTNMAEPASCYFGVSGVVFSDIRFKNEMEAIKKADGFLWRMKRGEGLGGDSALHQSEAEQLEVPDDYFDAVIDNRDISLEQLEKKVGQITMALDGGYL